MKQVTLNIDNKWVTVPEGITVLEASKTAGINIPTLCFLKEINEVGACRMCMVEADGKVQASCVYPVADGMVVKTNTPKIRDMRKVILELILANHNSSCTICVRNNSCELQALSKDLNMTEELFEREFSHNIDDLSPSIVRDDSRCINCGRCANICNNIQKVGVLGFVHRSDRTKVGTVYDKPLAELSCINCGQCIVNCPVGALREKDNTEAVWEALADSKKYVVVQTAPAVRAGLGEEFGYAMGTSVTGKMVAALRRLGFEKVFDTDFAADVTIMEEGTELLNRIGNGGILPMITSCSPGWIKYCEHNYPELLGNLSTCKSPQNMMGALLKSHYARMVGVKPEDMVVVSIMPCTAKKFEVQRDELEVDGLRDVDISITTRELARMIKEARIEFTMLEDEAFDPYYGDSTGAAVIFGATGGVMEAALRTVADILTKQDLQSIEYNQVRGIEGIKEASIQVTEDLTVKVAVAHGGANIKKLMSRIKNGEAEYHFVEIMACPGGCVNGGGQPIVSDKIKMEVDVRTERAKALYQEDSQVLTLRKSHENPSVKRLYEEFLQEPNSHKSHKLLHTHYQER
ncbi:MAG: 2Fe-2S iron-sulfur cluster binding domain-containing protein [Eubacteriaceae bacterium]|nr:2Fe-2S iron-sulfur cluster binding domain-containing protein [Eubacteriaceae bacterium]